VGKGNIKYQTPVNNNFDKFIYWAPRILSIIFVLFLVIFSLDVFEPGKSVQEILISLFIHNASVFLLAAAVAISWKREAVGGITFIAAGLFYTAMAAAGVAKNGFEWHMLTWFLAISGPAFLVGGLYLVSWRHDKPRK